MLRYLCGLAVILGVTSASDFSLKPCRIGDNTCSLASAQAFVPILANGIPELRVSSLDPLLLKMVKSEGAGLELTLKNNTVTGLKRCTLEETKVDSSISKFDVVARCSVVLRGWYNLRGEILTSRNRTRKVHGDGRDTIKIRDIVITASANLATVQGSDGQQHWHINSWKHSYDVRTRATFRFENLYDGNLALAEVVEWLMNSQWKVMMTEIAPPIVHAMAEGVIQVVEAFFAAVPDTDLYIA